MARSNNTTWFVLIALVAAYMLVPNFKDSMDNMFDVVGGASGDAATICPVEKTEMRLLGERDPGTILFLNGVFFGIAGDAILVQPGDKIELFYKTESNKYWDERVPCDVLFDLVVTVPQDIKTSYVSEQVEDPFALDYGSGGTILPELDNTTYDFESLEELNLDI